MGSHSASAPSVAAPHVPLSSSALAILEEFWGRRALSLAMAVGVAGLSGFVFARLMPRGPVDSGQALALLFGSLIAGVVAGFIMRSGWAALFAPLASLAIFELVRRGEVGPSVDAINLETTFGIIGLLVGRGVYVLISFVPMIAGAIYGSTVAQWLSTAALSMRSAEHRRMRRSRVALIGGTAFAVAGLALSLARPATVPAVTDANGNKIDGSVAELIPVDLGGHEQWIEIRGANPDNPVILYLNGGPGQSDLALSRVLLEPLHQDFTVVGWDQRGTGKSYGSLDPETLTLDAIVSDTIELTNYLRDRFDQEKIYLLTESWGSIPGILAVQQHPELYHAYIGSGQMVDVQETDRIIYDDLLAYAEATGDTDLADKLEGFGPPPYADIWAYAFVVQNYGLIEDDFDPPQPYVDRAEASGVGFFGIMGSEYTLIDKANVIRGLLDMASFMYPQIQEIDFRQQAATLQVPVYLFDGEHELRGRRELAHQWFDLLDAPVKEMFTFEHAGHAPAFEYADELHRILVEVIVPEATATA
ncbi:MAG: alpha/beta fold hydrolase [Thermomicrobiales bacterium]|nr:alpha/beta fold hydrolase [Thermomicrobiales bacterium]MCO5220466.1 alpha/beta hydrolase [Thermomicrobiales bacterium]